jgi:hypothetical protein
MNVPDVLRGRVMSVYTTVFAGSVPAGGLIMGAIASRWGVPLALGIGGALSLGVGILAIPWYRRIEAGRRVDRERDRAARLATLAAADIGAIDPDGRSAGTISAARPR